jgi:hypothetical protein
MRLGKWVEHLKAAAQASDAKHMDPVLRYCAVGRQLGYAGYLVLDNMTVVCIFYRTTALKEEVCWVVAIGIKSI